MSSWEVGFVSPSWLALLVGLPAFLWFLQHSEVRKRRKRELLGFAPEVASRPFTVPVVIYLLLSLALARPYFGKETAELQQTGERIMVLFDVSRSMLARDIQPSRLELGKRKLKDLVRLIRAEGRGDALGITLFAGASYLFCPLTQDYAVFLQFIDEISTELVTSFGSNLQQALTSVAKDLPPTARVLVITDGETGVTEQKLNPPSVRVDVLGVGTDAGSRIQLDDGSFVVNDEGVPVVTKLAEQQLQALAAEGNGHYHRATLTDEDLRAVLSSRSRASNGESEQVLQTQLTIYHEVTSWIAAVVLALLAFSLGGRKSAGLIAFLVAMHSSVQISHASPYEAYKAYEEGRFQDAASEYDDALKEDPSNLKLKQGLASSLFKLGKYDEAQKLFGEIAETSASVGMRFENKYNEGNAHLQASRYKDAVNSYEQALKIEPEEPRALHNLQIARTLLLTKTPTPTPTPPSQGKEPTPSPSAKPSPSSSKSDSSSPQPKSDNGEQGKHETPPNFSPSAAPNPRTNPSDDMGGETQPASALSPQPTPEPKKFREEEAKMWLDSIPESPLVVPRERMRQPPPGGQTW